jgi:hypothetical protein
MWVVGIMRHGDFRPLDPKPQYLRKSEPHLATTRGVGR